MMMMIIIIIVGVYMLSPYAGDNSYCTPEAPEEGGNYL
jgi:hypothetical protein